MSSDKFIGSLLKTLSASKPTGNFLEIGTGTGLALAWVVDGMDTNSKIISIDNDPKLLEVAVEAFQGDNRVQLVCAYGEQWLEQYNGEKFDLIFADSWPGKYCAVHKTLNLLKSGGFYVIDDMFPQAGWLDGHQQKAETLIDYLENNGSKLRTQDPRPRHWQTFAVGRSHFYIDATVNTRDSRLGIGLKIAD